MAAPIDLCSPFAGLSVGTLWYDCAFCNGAGDAGRARSAPISVPPALVHGSLARPTSELDSSGGGL
jgi:hypothetical protein